MHLDNLYQSPVASELVGRLRQEEEGRQIQRLPVRELTLTDGGDLCLAGRVAPLSGQAHRDLAALAAIPEPYYRDMDAELRAINVNHRLPQKTAIGEVLTIIWNDSAVDHIRRERLVHVPRGLAMQALLDQAPAAISPDDIRAVVYALNGHVDLSLISHALSTEPQMGDVVCGGVHLTIEEDGTVQVGPASFRLCCKNGAMARVCAEGQHRIRRSASDTACQNLLRSLSRFARSAWQAWEHVATGLTRLARTELDPGAVEQLVPRLRGRPFLVSARAARHVQAALNGTLVGGLTLYDLHNALTYVGSHDRGVLPRYRYRLRLGAGALAQGNAEVCRACQQLILA